MLNLSKINFWYIGSCSYNVEIMFLKNKFNMSCFIGLRLIIQIITYTLIFTTFLKLVNKY